MWPFLVCFSPRSINLPTRHHPQLPHSWSNTIVEVFFKSVSKPFFVIAEQVSKSMRKFTQYRFPGVSVNCDNFVMSFGAVGTIIGRFEPDSLKSNKDEV